MKLMPRVIINLLIVVLASSYAFGIDVRVPIKSKYDQSQEYPMALLRFILDKSGIKYDIIFSDVGITTQARQIEMLKRNEEINIGWFGTSAQLEKELVPIRFPIWRGLLGYRVFIINKANQPIFDMVNTLDDLKKFTGVQGIGWSDIAILENSGLMQIEAQYDAAFEMISKGRVDYFSRGITEAFREVELHQKEFPNLTVEQHLLLVYPFAGFFFTNSDNQDLAQALIKGFKEAYSDGSFLKFFYSQPAVMKVLEQTNIDSRTRIDIPNPLLTNETLMIPSQYWYKR